MANRKKGAKKKKAVEETKNEPVVFEPNPPKKRLALAVTFGVLAVSFLGYLLVIAIASR